MATETNKFLNIIETVYKTTGANPANQQLKDSAKLLKELKKAFGSNPTILKSLTPSISKQFPTAKEIDLLTFAFRKANGELRKMEIYIDSVTGELMRLRSVSPTSLPRTSPYITGNFPNQPPDSFSGFLKTNPSIPITTVGQQIRKEMPKPYEYKDLANAYVKNKEAVLNLGDAHKKALSELGKMARRAVEIVPIWMAIRTVYQSFIQLLQNSFKFLVEWETVMAKIAVVGGGTREELGKLSKDLLKLATAFGVSLNDLGEGARLWAQQGKTYAEVIPLMRTTAKLSIVTGRSMKDSVEDITSVMYSFGLEAENTTKIVDSLVAIDLKFAITTDVMAESLRKVGPVAKQMGLSLEKTLGIITATHLATRAKGGEIGNSLKTIFTRLATVSRDAIQTLAKVPVFLDEAGLATTENTGTFRDWGTILDEIANKYDTLDGSIQEDLAYQLAGVRQVTKLKAAFAQWKEQLEATNTALNSEGASQRAVNILLDTSEAKARRLAGAWNELVDTVADTRGWKGLLDVLREAVLLTRDLAENAELAGPALALGEAVVPKGNVDAKPLLKRIMEQGVGGVFPELFKQRVEGAGDDKVTSELKKELAETAKLVEAKASGNLIDKETQEIELKRLDSLRDYGVEEAEIARKKLAYLTQDKTYNDKDILNKRNQLKSEIETLDKKKSYTDFLLKEELVAKRLEGFGYNRIQIAIAELARKEAYLKAQNIDIENNKDIIKQRQEILQLVQEEINAYSKGLQDTLSGGLTDLLKGETTISQFGDNIASSVKDSVLGAFSSGVVEKIFQSTGIGQIFGTEIAGIRHLFDKTPKNLGEMIYDSHVRGIKDGFAQANLAKSLTGGAGGTGGLIQGILGLFGESDEPKKWLTRNAASKKGGTPGVQGGLLSSLGGLSGLAGGALNAGMVGYSAYQSAGGSSGNRGLGLAAGAMGGIGAGLMMIPSGVTQVIGGAMMVGSMLLGMFKKSVDVQTEIKNETKQVASKIQLSNKELSVVNRNLVALKNEKTFILPESAYFSTAANIGDAFALHSSRGLA